MPVLRPELALLLSLTACEHADALRPEEPPAPAPAPATTRRRSGPARARRADHRTGDPHHAAARQRRGARAPVHEPRGLPLEGREDCASRGQEGREVVDLATDSALLRRFATGLDDPRMP